MRFLIDTCVISEIRRAGGDPRVRERLAEVDSDRLFLSVVTVGELTKGIFLLSKGARRDGLESWLLRLERDYADRILAVDIETSRIWGDITAKASREGMVIPACDGLIAATAIRHGLHVMTRDVDHFRPTGAMLVNPWSDGGTQA